MSMINEALFQFKGAETVVVDSITPKFDLIVRRVDGSKGIVHRNEISIHEKNDQQINRLIGRELRCIKSVVKENGLIVLSAKEHEVKTRRQIEEDFASQTRNVYDAQLISVQTNKLIYLIAPAIGVTVLQKDFAYTYLRSFEGVTVPRECKLVLKSIEGLDIRATLKPAFGDFKQNIQMGNLEEGSRVKGFVSGSYCDGSFISIAPNLSTMVTGNYDYTTVADLTIQKIKTHENKVVVSLNQVESTKTIIDFSHVIDNDYGPWLDLDEFERRTVVKKDPKEDSNTSIELSYDLTEATSSPFWTYEKENIRRYTSNASIADIRGAVARGHLTAEHRQVAMAVNALKYTSMYQLQRFMDLQGEFISPKKLKSCLDYMVKLGILNDLTFEGCRTKIFYCGEHFYEFTGAHVRRFPTWERLTTDAALIKRKLASNQLLISQLRTSTPDDKFDAYPDMLIGSSVRVRPSSCLTKRSGKLYIEGFRKPQYDDMLQKLKRYDQYFCEADEKAEVAVIIEKESDLESATRNIAGLKLRYNVYLTCDLMAFTRLDTIEASKSRSGFSRFWSQLFA